MLVQSQLQTTLDDYLKQVDKEASRLLLLTAREQRLIPKHLRDAREKAHEESKAANIALVNALKQALPEKFASEVAEPPADALLKIVHHEGAKLGVQNYASLGSILLHLLRDWSAECDHVIMNVYAPMVAQLQERLPARKSVDRMETDSDAAAQCAEARTSQPPSVLVPGSGLSRLAYMLMKEGYEVECNEFSPAFATVANYIFNECRTRHNAFPLAHVFGENYGLSNQYLQVETPSLLPLEERGAGESMVMTTGDFVYLYKAGGPAHRKFDCVATCFFIDTCDDLLDYIETIDGVLKDGGMWINLGPLNYKKDLKLKLAWEELQAVWEGMGYEFVQSSRVYTPYHLPAGLKLYTEQYDAVFTTAIKRPRPSP